VRFASITLCAASQRVFIVAVLDFVIDFVRKLLDTPSYVAMEHYRIKVINTVHSFCQNHLLRREAETEHNFSENVNDLK